jgi:hypothetical protein
LTPRHQSAVGNEAPAYELARADPEALGFILVLHPEYPITWVRDPWPSELVDPRRQLPDGTAWFSCTVGVIQASIRVVQAGDAARVGAGEALLAEKGPQFSWARRVGKNHDKNWGVGNDDGL